MENKVAELADYETSTQLENNKATHENIYNSYGSLIGDSINFDLNNLINSLKEILAAYNIYDQYLEKVIAINLFIFIIIIKFSYN